MKSLPHEILSNTFDFCSSPFLKHFTDLVTLTTFEYFIDIPFLYYLNLMVNQLPNI